MTTGACRAPDSRAAAVDPAIRPISDPVKRLGRAGSRFAVRICPEFGTCGQAIYFSEVPIAPVFANMAPVEVSTDRCSTATGWTGASFLVLARLARMPRDAFGLRLTDMMGCP